ncbi:MAG: DUF72 domain-containing protein [Candidatus Dormibacteraeota bacterium]|nr:DUF72 domain-containing protein [Candidatus Dormibacteraeota bacterium]
MERRTATVHQRDALHHAADAEIGSLYVGTSGFSYPEWRGDFYPEKTPSSRFLEEYARRLNAVEINNTFQRFPREVSVAAWVKGSPPGFKFCLKAQRSLTYSAAAFPKGAAARDFGEQMGPLGERAGPVLLQFPPTKKRDLEVLEALLANLARPVAAEFRDPSWLDADVAAAVARHGGAIVVTDQEEWPLATPSGPFHYYRLRRDYSQSELGAWSERLSEEARNRDVYAFFRHSPEAPARALALLASTGGRR